MRKGIVLLCSLFFTFSLKSQTITANPGNSVCAPQTVTLSLNPTNNNNYQWQQGPSSSGPWVNIGAPAPNTTLVVSSSNWYQCIGNGGGPQTDYPPIRVTINAKPTAAFSANPNNQCSNVPVLFTNNSVGSGLSYQWNFGDPNSGASNVSTLANPSHVFVGTIGNGNQNFNVQLIVTSSSGCKDTANLAVTTAQLPDPSFAGYTIYNGKRYFKSCSNTGTATFTFVNGSSTVNTNYQIIWGDGTPDYNAPTFSTPLTHTYPIGTTQVTFIVTSSNGCKDTMFYYVFLGTNPAVGLGNPGNTAVCNNNTLTFPISSTGSNSPGTIYTVTFNDGSAPVSFNHPAPSDISHTFLVTSCGTTSGTYQNSFSATIQASNPCASSTASVVPIYVSQKTPPALSITPKDTICVNTTATFTNTTGSNFEIDNGTGLCTIGKWIWSVTPSTGWTLTSGSFGSDNTFPLTSAFWTNGSNAISLNFNTVGTYTIKLKTGNTACGVDSIVRTICVNPTPVAAFTLSENVGCTPLTVNTVNNSNTPLCGQNSYLWNVTYVPTSGCTPNTIGYTYINGTSSTSSQPQFQFNNPGVYTISLITISPAAACTSNVVSQTVTIKAKPIVALNLPLTACQLFSINPSATATCYTTGATFLWTFPGGTPATATTLNPGTVIFNTTGTPTISLAVTNECGTTTVQQAITINPTPILSVPSNQTLCAGQTAGPYALSSSNTVATITWTNTNPAIGLPASGSSNPILFTATNSGATTISGTITVSGTTSANCTGTNNFTVTVNPRPSAPLASNVQYCQNALAVPLTATATSGNTLLWYTVATGGTGSTIAPTPSTAALGSVTYYVSQINTATQCESPRTPITVTVYVVPSITGVSAGPTSCNTATGTITISGLIANATYTLNYLFNGLPIVTTITATATGTYVITNLAAGSYTNLTVTANQCPSNPLSFNLTDPNPPATPVITSNNSPVCVGQTITLTANTATGVATYNWFGPSFSGSGATINISNATIGAAGTYTVTATIAGCTSSPATTTVIVNPLPTISGTFNACINGTSTLTGSGTPALVSPWVSSNTAVATISNLGLVTAFSAGTTQITYTNSNNCKATITFTVNALPTINGQNSVCIGSSINLTGSAAPLSVTPWVSLNTGIATVSGSTITGNVIGVGVGTATIEYTNSNGCKQTKDIIVNPLPVITGANVVCVGLSIILSGDGTPAASSPWVSSNTGIATVTNLGEVTGISAGTVTITYTNSNGCKKTHVITVNPTPSAPLASNVQYCQNVLAVPLTATATSGNTLLWYNVPTGGTGSSTAPTPSTAALGSVTYYVSQINTATQCESPRTPITVTVYVVPSITGVSAGPTSCNTATGTITISGLIASATYTLNYLKNGLPVVTTITATATGTYVITNLAAGSYTNLTVTANQCISNALNFTLSDPSSPPAPAVVNNSPLCEGGTITLTASTSASGTATYIWTGPGIVTPVNGSTLTVANATVAAAGTYNVTVTIANCTSPSTPVNVVVNPTPPAPVVSSNAPLCADSTLQLTASLNFSGIVSWQWTGPNTFSSTQQNPVIVNATTANSGTYAVVATAQVGNCPSSQSSITVLVKPTPIIGGVSFTNPTACSSSTGSISLTGLTPSTLYTVNYQYNSNPVSVSISSNGSGAININNLPAGTYSAIYVLLNGCKSLTVGPVTLTDPAPPATPEAFSNSPLCLNTTLNLSATAVTPGVLTYNWTGPNTFSSTQQNPVISGVTAANAGWYYVSVTQNNCTSLKDSVFVVVNPLAVNPTATSPIEYCVNVPAVSLTANALPAHTLNWYTVATGGTALSSAPVPSTATVGTFTYYVSQSTPEGCEGGRIPVDVIIRPDAKALFIPTDTIKCPPFVITPAVVNLQIFPFNSLYSWYANNVLIGTGTLFPGYTINNQDDSVQIKLVVQSPWGCKADSIQRKFYTYKLPTPSFLKDTVGGCGPLSVQFTNTTPNINVFTYQWDFGNGQTSTAAQPAPVLFTPSLNYNDTFYVVKLKVFSICDTLVYTDSVLIKSKPKALFTPSRTSGCSPLRVVFTNTSLGFNNTYYWDFGDGTTQVTTSAAPIAHTFNTGVVDTFFVKLIAVNQCGSDSITYNIIASPNTIALNFTVNGTQLSGCNPHAVAFINNTFGASSFQWNFGDGNIQSTTSGIDTVYHSYAAAGTYTATLLAVNSCTDTAASIVINVYPKPIANFSPSVASICIGQSVTFNNQSVNATSYLWYFGDGTTSTLNNPTHSYAVAGTYSVRLITYRTNPGGSICVDSIIRVINVAASLPATVSVSAISSTCAPFTVTFVNRNTPSTLVNWNFGDGNTATGDSVVHTYTTAGTYTATATILVPTGCTYNWTQVITVGGPSGTFNYTGGYYCYPANVRFDAVATGATSYLWDFGDGNTQTTTSPTVFHTYANPGTYNPVLTLQNTAGCAFVVPGTQPVRIDKVDAGFGWSSINNCGNTSYTFTDTSTAYFGIAQTTWNFGDGNVGAGSPITHQYTSSGTYPVSMTVTGISGCTKTVTTPVAITVRNIPTATISADAVRCANENVSFTANIASVDPLNVVQWQLSNGVTGNGNVFTYNFTVAANYTMQLVVSTIYGCADTATHSITINPVPFVIATGTNTICLGNTAPLNATGATSYQWSPTNGLSCTTCPNPIASPTTTTPYIVIGTNNFNCSSTDTAIVTVIQPLNMTVSPNDSICIGQSANLLVSGAASYIWSPATGLSNTTVSNPIATPTVTTRYRVIGYDGQNCFTDTAFVLVAVGDYPTVSLGPDKTLSTGTLFPLATIITNGPIAQWLWLPDTDLSCNDCALPVATIKKNITYTVTVTSVYGCSASDTINIKTFCADSQVFIPNAFTPDGDGINDVLMVRAKGIVSVKSFRIFNRWGELVFERNNFPPNVPMYGWDGRIRGKAAPPDVFVYTAEVVCENGTPFTYKGNTSIIK